MHPKTLTVSFIAVSLHSVEHMYLYWLYVTHSPAYTLGGWNGILGQGGLVGSSLARPYLHLVYNVIEVTPFVLAFYDQSRLVYDRRAAPRPAGAAVDAGSDYRKAPDSVQPADGLPFAAVIRVKDQRDDEVSEQTRSPARSSTTRVLAGNFEEDWAVV